MKYYAIAIDGPSSSGKSTIAKIIAKKLNFLYVDTGAMYRAFTYACLIKGIDPKIESESIKLIGHIDISFNDENHITLDGVDISKEIRSIEVNDNVSYISSYKDVRIYLIEEQRKIALNHNVVMDGRDIGSFVLPNADVKIFQVAEVKERAKRRYKENLQKGISCTFDDILDNLKKRDYIDSHRSYSPLKKADDAVILDTTYMSIDEVINSILKIVNNKGIKQ